jgi:hypothetical protein
VLAPPPRVPAIWEVGRSCACVHPMERSAGDSHVHRSSFPYQCQYYLLAPEGESNVICVSTRSAGECEGKPWDEEQCKN